MARITLGEDRIALEASDKEYRSLEAGDILYFPTAPPLVTDEEKAFLVTQKQADASFYKNISYRPTEDRLKGVDQKDTAQWKRAHEIMRAFSARSIAFMASLLKKYTSDWKIDYASFRPIEEEGRKAALHARNDLLHFDSFPTRPSHGDRLLRIFVNINPEQPRVWLTSDHFEALAPRFAGKVGLTRSPSLAAVCKQSGGEAGRRHGAAGDRPASV